MSNANDTHNLCIPPWQWQGITLIARLNGRSISAEAREALINHLTRHGLSQVDGVLTVNPAIWPAEICEGGGNPGLRKI